MNDLDDLLAGRHRLQHFLTNGAGAHLVDKGLGDRQRDIGLKQGAPHLAHGLVHVFLAQGAAPLEPGKNVAEAACKVLEHF